MASRRPRRRDERQMINEPTPAHLNQPEVRTVPYDLIKEIAIAMVVSLVVIIGFALFLSSPDVPSVTIQSWSAADPADFVTTANDELAGASTTANYGPPYNSGDGAVQSIGPISPQTWAGIHVTVDQPHDFVINPLRQAAGSDSQVTDAVNTYEAASADQQTKWHDAYAAALQKATVDSSGQVTVVAGDYGPVGPMLNRLLQLAQSGALDGLLLSSDHFYQ